MYSNLAVRNLPIGAKLGSSIFDDRQTKLLAAGMEITEQLLQSLLNRNVDTVVVSKRDLSRLTAFRPQGKARSAPADRASARSAYENDVSRLLDTHAAETRHPPLTPSRDPFAARVKPVSHGVYDRDFTNYIADQREYHVDRMLNVAETCIKGDSSLVGELTGVVGESLDSAVEDLDAYTCLGANPFTAQYPTRHSIHVAMLASSIAVRLQLDEASITSLATGCLLHDIGMLAVDQMAVAAKKHLEPDEFAEIAKHPIKTFELIERHLETVTPAARMVAYQMHERADGSGYPRGRTLPQIHPLARIAAVADAYAALVAPRPHRPGMMPYYAIEKLLRDVSRGLYDPQAVRGLLSAVALFPIGSFVELSNGYVGRILRANGEDYMHPVIEVWKAGSLSNRSSILNLQIESNVRVVKPLADLHAH